MSLMKKYLLAVQRAYSKNITIHNAKRKFAVDETLVIYEDGVLAGIRICLKIINSLIRKLR